MGVREFAVREGVRAAACDVEASDVEACDVEACDVECDAEACDVEGVAEACDVEARDIEEAESPCVTRGARLFRIHFSIKSASIIISAHFLDASA